MGRSRGKGGNKRKKGKNFGDLGKRELLYQEEGQVYGQISKLLGNSRVLCNCFDKEERQCTIRGKLKNRVWMNVGDIVLISLRDIDPQKGDIIHKYLPGEIKRLIKDGEIPESIKFNEEDGAGDDEFFGDGEEAEIAPQDKQRTAGLLDDSDENSEEEEKKEETEEDLMNQV